MNYEKLADSLGFKNKKYSGGYVMFSCPFAKEKHDSGQDNTPSFGINIKNGYYNCFTCGSQGHINSLIKNKKIIVLNLNSFNKKKKSVIVKEKGIKFEGLKSVLDFKHPKKYLLDRGLDIDLIKRLKIKYIKSDQDSFMAGRIIIPIIVNGICVGLVGRDFNSKREEKYLYNKGFNRSKYLWGMDLAKKYKNVYVVEGVFDRITFLKYGKENVVTSFGCHLAAEQRKELIANFDEIILAYDGDLAGTSGMIKEHRKIKNKGTLIGHTNLKKGDWGDLINSEDKFLKAYGDISYYGRNFGILDNYVNSQ